jgi:hypothetical protein
MMSTSPKKLPETEEGTRSAEQRAEALMESVVSGGSRFVSKLVGRVREEVEDIVAEARTIGDRGDSAANGADRPAR